LHADGGRQVHDHVDLPGEHGHEWSVQDRAFPQVEARVVEQVTNVVDGAGGDVVEGNDGISARYERVGQVRADEAGTAGDEVVHGGRRWSKWMLLVDARRGNHADEGPCGRMSPRNAV